ncbi:MAG: ABC transporter substrate-binding protein [Paracoccus sp. (in: a-proteobacteria)]|jgi:peptide/nickel transport system substrate-binding protein|uniref:ABC transporter substrate-binding protein n=1 Tax=unclassified Paracoccus (in: a-proteobacteria) TaxID=2688777 RepID=UPI000C45C533|nr:MULTISPECIES: ABC transporter substrate-binding protein [unclassified Paracoccus (in: a-proteobacteria)]MBA49636.1 peptide ABC transporter substrate-binding protein [Paracoccus sp. (in: a-proteobacteria)]|tara:strand:+ start:2449 stop:4029 length:1581 start_codon:yes stop_codon:yes gene_type:complete
MLKHIKITATATAAAAILALAGPLAAQDAKPQTGGTLNVVIQPEPPGLMIGLLQNGPTQMVAGDIYESLLRYDSELKPSGQLAESWEISEDGKTYTFKLRKGVVFHDGEPFTSADVKFSMDKFLRETHSRMRTYMEHVESIDTPDDYTVVFKLKQPFGPFLGIFEPGTAPVIPKHIYEGTDFANNPANANPIGTGPFKFAEWVKGSYIRLVRNEDYYMEGKPYVDEIYYQVIPDAASRAVAYETGQVDVLPGGAIENFDVPRIREMDNTCITDKGWEYFGPLSWIWINLDNKPLDDLKVRKAMMYALDREFARDALWSGLGKVATGPLSSSTRFYSAETPDISYDPEKARQLLEESSYDGETIRLLGLPYGETWQRWAEAVKQNLTEIGMNVEIVPSDVAGWNQKVSDRDFDLAFTYLYQYGDPALGVSRTYMSTNAEPGSPWNNVADYQNPEVDKLFEEAALMADPEERRAAYKKVQDMIVSDVPNLWLLELGFPTIYRCNIKNPVNTALGVNDGFRDVWIDKAQ